jgi:tetratricopeptide (TPR) repeat protein/predicted AlkP superfamily phosphohydrolase/phosphomutase
VHPRSFLLLLGACLLTACARGPQEELWLIGLDGADWDLLEPMIAAGELPHLAALRAEGAYGRLRSDEPMLSPILWTSIATGKTADLHGVTWFMSDAPDGSKVPVSSHNRWVRALWTIASERDQRVGVVGWWATWPADPVRGFTVSDYVGWHSFGVSGQSAEVPGKTYPPELYAEIARHFPQPDAIDPLLLQRMVHLPVERLGFDASAGPFGGPVQHLRQAIATTTGYLELTLERLRDERPRLLMLYFEGTDAAMHLFGNYAEPRLPWVDEVDFAAYRDVVREYWKWQDEQLGRLLAQRGPRTTVMIVSDHGFRVGPERLKEEEFTIDRADQSHMPDGIVLLAGPDVAAQTRIENATIYDVTPTALHLLGLPVAADMQGRVLEQALRPEFNAAHPIASIASYEGTPFARAEFPTGDVDAEAMAEMLRSLGYISGGEGEVSTPGNVEQAVNLAIVQRRRGKLAEAEATLVQALETVPSHVEARSNLARILAETGRYDEAATIYRQLYGEQPNQLQHLEDLALTLAHAGDDRGALAAYESGLQRDANWALGHAGRGFALHKLKQTADGLGAVDRALELDPSLASAHYYRGVILDALQRRDEAIVELQRALQLDPGHGPATLELSRMGGGGPDVLASLERAHALSPDDAQVSAELGAQYLRAQRPRDALPLLSEAAAKLPDSVELQGNLGMAYAMTGELTNAALQFERVLELSPDNFEATATLGQLRMQLGQPERAERWLRRAAELAPQNAGVQYSLGEFYHRTGRLDLAKKQYEAAIRIDPSVGAFHYQLAMVYGQQGDESKAMELIAKARQLDPSLPEPPRQ